jgi:ERCC4-type nuclease
MKTTYTAPVQVDDRTGSIEFANRLRALLLPVEVCRLDFADFAFTGIGHDGAPLYIGIERKSILTSDLLNSIQTGRLKDHQLPGMAAHYEHRYLLIEGVYRRGETGKLEVLKGGWRGVHGGLPYTYLDNHLTSMEVMFGVRVRRSTGEADTARVVEGLYKYWQKPEHTSCVSLGHGAALPAGYKPGLTVRWAKELEGVGLKRAIQIGKRFTTPEELMGAGERELREVEGIGKGLARQIWSKLHEQRKTNSGEDHTVERRAA